MNAPARTPRNELLRSPNDALARRSCLRSGGIKQGINQEGHPWEKNRDGRISNWRDFAKKGKKGKGKAGYKPPKPREEQARRTGFNINPLRR